jgi:hypothetical protein
VFALRQSGTSYRWDSAAKVDTARVRRGEALLFGGTRSYAFALDSSVAPDLNPFLFTAAQNGWRLISNPFPFAFPMAKLSSNQGTVSFLKKLAAGGAAGARQYSWAAVDSAAALIPFAGYAYFFRAGEQLTLDPLKGLPTGKAMAAGRGGALQAALGDQTAECRLFAHGQGFPIPALPAPGAAFDVRLGPEGFWSAEVDWSGFEIPLRLIAPHVGNVRVTLAPEPFAAAPGFSFALWDSASGRGYAGDALSAVPAAAGENRYALLGGTATFVQARLAHLQASVSDRSGFRIAARPGGWRLDFVLPPRPGGYDGLEISLRDAQGRLLAVRAYGSPNAGPQTMELDAPGGAAVYFCRVRAMAGGRMAFNAVRKVVP